MLKTKVSLIERHEFSFIVDTDDEGVADAAIDKWLERCVGGYEDGDQDAFEKVERPDIHSTFIDADGRETEGSIPSEGAWAIDGDGAILLTAGEGTCPGSVNVNYGPGADRVELTAADLKPFTKSRAKELGRLHMTEGRYADNDGVYR